MVRGRVEGIALTTFAGAMEVVLKDRGVCFIVDVARVDSWSLVAQAMVLETARRKATRGEQVVLRGATQRLREQSRQLGVFEHVRSITGTHTDSPGGPAAPPAGRGLRQSVPPAATAAGR
ncbi:MAG TPA: hypothetical protein VFO49_06320 [Nocardioides sp.]|nr:hypothetical protein [Nocardioides sp.]